MGRRKHHGTSGAAATPALRALEDAGVPHRVLEFDAQPAPGADSGAAGYGEQAAAALGRDPESVFKTLMVALPDGELAACLVPVSGTLDLRAAAHALGVKRVSMADPAVAERRSGYVRGGISPLGQRRPHRTVVDASALARASMCLSAGLRGLDVELAPEDLVRVTEAEVAAIAAP